jgi:hypothetical protein
MSLNMSQHIEISIIINKYIISKLNINQDVFSLLSLNKELFNLLLNFKKHNQKKNGFRFILNFLFSIIYYTRFTIFIRHFIINFL